MKVAVTGALGFIGRHLVARLQSDGYEVAQIDLLGNPPRDVRHPEDLYNAFEGAETVFHLAADNSSTAKFYTHPEWVLEVGARGILNVITEAKRVGVKTLVVASSAEVYGEPLTIPTPETEPLKIADPSNPRHAYAASKILTEVAALTCGGFERVIVARPHNAYGEGQPKGHVIPDLLEQIRMLSDKYVLNIRGVAHHTRAFCHVSDIVEGFVWLLKRGDSGVYHLGTDQEVTLGELAKMIAPNRKHVYFGAPAGSPERRCPDISKMRALGWEPEISLADGIASLLQSAVNHADA